ncbi:MAG: hypothetical protein P4L98_24155 [Ancalomicrobiaceae bacterium]|nr:hypothetical protein [Ancalomicrobiaceae bacterium]
MQLDLRTISIKPLRQTFGHLARRMGADKPASRYIEGTMDLQPVENFHYRPSWDPDFDIFDPRRTAIVMKDWYALKDPRQFFYGAWVLARARMQDAAEADFALVEERGLAAAYPEAGKAVVRSVLLPLRHLAWGANINDSFIGAHGYGIAISQAATYAAMDQLGIAQYLTRLALAFSDIEALAAAKSAWLEAPLWQGLRRYVEDLMVTGDWFEVLVAQNVVLDGLLYPLVYDRLADALDASHGPVVSLLTRFQSEWAGENAKWLDAVIKVAAADSPENAEKLAAWVGQWRARALEAVAPVAEAAFGAEGAAVLAEIAEDLSRRLTKAGLSLGASA